MVLPGKMVVFTGFPKKKKKNMVLPGKMGEASLDCTLHCVGGVKVYGRVSI